MNRRSLLKGFAAGVAGLMVPKGVAEVAAEVQEDTRRVFALDRTMIERRPGYLSEFNPYNQRTFYWGQSYSPSTARIQEKVDGEWRDIEPDADGRFTFGVSGQGPHVIRSVVTTPGYGSPFTGGVDWNYEVHPKGDYQVVKIDNHRGVAHNTSQADLFARWCEAMEPRDFPLTPMRDYSDELGAW
jgi:hypothetical protein